MADEPGDTYDAAKTVRPITFANGGWLLAALAAVSVLGAISLFYNTQKRVGDGSNVATYGFDLSTTRVPREQIVAGGMARDFLPAAVNPVVMPIEGAEQNSLRRPPYKRFLSTYERMAGVVVNGEARAYPINSLVYNEIVNDVVGGVPIAVTYNALCDGVVVFERTVNGAVLEFGVSGLVYNSNLIMYDRQAADITSSLWSQLQWRAIAGPAAAQKTELKLLPVQIMPWDEWKLAHPNTTVMVPDAEVEKQFDQLTYTTYFATDKLKFAVEPKWDATRLPNKTPVAAISVDAVWKIYVLPELVKLSAEQRAAALKRDGVKLRWHEATKSVTAEAEAGHVVQTVYCYLFAWYAMHPEWMDGASGAGTPSN